MGKLVVTEHGHEISTHVLGEEPLFIGRIAACDILLADGRVSRKHAAVIEKDEVAAVKDLDSANGVFVNGRKIANAIRLKHLDVIEIGSFSITYYAESGEQTASGEKPAAEKESVVEHDGFEPKQSISGEILTELDNMNHSRPSLDEDSTYMDMPNTEVMAVNQNKKDDYTMLGEFEEIDAVDDIPISTSLSDSGIIDVSRELVEVIEERLRVYSLLDKLERQRDELLAQENLPEDAASELQRQQRELLRLPDAKRAKANLEKMAAKLEKFLTSPEEKEAPEEDQKESEEQAEARKLSPEMAVAFDLAKKQWELCVGREGLEDKIVLVALPHCSGQVLLRLFREKGIEADRLFGWAVYALALESVREMTNRRRSEIRDSLRKKENGKQGFLQRLRGSEKDEDKVSSLQEEEAAAAARVIHITRELASSEGRMIDLFWETYAKAAHLIIDTAIKGEEGKYLRAFLRYGLLGSGKGFITPQKLDMILSECEKSRVVYDKKMDATHILYADEYLYFVAKGEITPGVDEDLELNQRNTPAWKADKAWRRIIHGRIEEAVLLESADRLQEKVDALQAEREDMQERLEKLIRGSRDFKKNHAELSQGAQHARVEGARFQRAKEKIIDEKIPKIRQAESEAREKLMGLEEYVKPDYLLGRESCNIRRLCRLLANLKESFPPFALRDNFKPDIGTVNNRDLMEKEFAELEKLDPTIFKESLIPVKKQSQRIYLRFSPVILLAPGCGFLGYSWNPRHGTETGRLTLPVYCPRGGLREKILHNMLSDFRWDTSKASAGMDLLLSETLVASYASVRWEYRRRSKEAREKAAIFNEDNDRKNWRRHYSLYLNSAIDGGRKLFFKNIEVYEQVIIKYIDLPEGVDRLRK